MSYIRKFKRKNKDGSIRTYYAEVEGIRDGKKVTQRYIRSLGTDPNAPDNLPLDKVHFGFIATRLMQGDLSTSELFDMIEKMGHHINRENLEKIGLYYSFKKNHFSLSLYRKRSTVKQKDADHVAKD
jgi:hypothetical protein